MPAQGTSHNPPHAPAPVPPPGGSGGPGGSGSAYIALPYINLTAHLREIMRRYDDFADAWNAAQLADRPGRARQHTLKPTHRALFRDVVWETASGMLAALRRHDDLLRDTGGAGLAPVLAVANPLVGDGFFVCFTSRHKLAERNRKNPATIYRNIARLAEAGIIAQRVGHGHKGDFELHVRAAFLVVSDRARPQWDPLAPEGGSPSPQFAFCTVKDKLIEQLKQSLHSAYAVENDSLAEASGPGGQEQRQEQRESRGPAAPAAAGQEQTARGPAAPPPGGPPPAPARALTAEMQGLYGRAYNRNPAWHTLQRTLFAQLFVDYAIERLWRPRGVAIYPEARAVAIDYAMRWYFADPLLKLGYHSALPPCSTEGEYAARLEMLCWCVDAANRYTARRRGYVPLPCAYLDLGNPKGFAATLAWWHRKRQNDRDRARARRARRDTDALRRAVLHVFHHPGREAYEQARAWVHRNLPRHLARFDRSVAHMLGQPPPAPPPTLKGSCTPPAPEGELPTRMESPLQGVGG